MFIRIGVELQPSSKHNKFVLTKISSSAGFINKLRRMLTPHMLTMLINAHINSVTDYCINIWGPSRIKDFGDIQNVTNNLLAMYFFPCIIKYKRKRFWCNRNAEELFAAKKECIAAHRKINYYDLLEKCNLFSITERLEYYSLWNIFKIRKFGSKVIAMNDLFSPRINNCNMKTRSSKNCTLITHNSKLYENSNLYYASSLWNTLPNDIVNFENPNQCFRTNLNKWLLDKRNGDFIHN